MTSVAFPLPLTYYNYTSTDNAIDELLYANLKLKKLIDEYKKIQEKSQQLVWDANYLFQQQDNTDSIYHMAASLKESSKKTMDESKIVLNYQTRTSSSNQNHLLKPSSSIPQIDANPTWATPKPAWSPADNTNGDNTTSRQRSNNPSIGGSDPFIVKVFISLANIIPYLITHKGEAVFYGIGLTLIFLFFSSIFRR